MLDKTPTEDKSFDALARAARELEVLLVRDLELEWEGSPFNWIRQQPPARKGSIGERLISTWAAEAGFEVRRPVNSGADRIINGHRIEVKLSTLWKTGYFVFQQIRDQEYDFCLCLGLLPTGAHAWLVPKSVIRTHATPQHTGSGGTDTLWLQFPATMPPAWMLPYGKNLADLAERLRVLGIGPH